MKELKEHLKRELDISDEEYQALVEGKRKELPNLKDSKSVGQLISFLIKHDETMSQMLNMVLMRLMQLENKVKELESNG